MLVLLTDRPGRPPSFVAFLHNVLANVPAHWPLQLFFPSHLRSLLATELVGVARLAASGRVTLEPLGGALALLDRKGLLLAPALWERARGARVLVVDPASALCGSAARTAADFVADGWDWVGAPWAWAKPGAPHALGGNGALSLRSRAHVLALLRHAAGEYWYGERSRISLPSPGI